MSDQNATPAPGQPAAEDTSPSPAASTQPYTKTPFFEAAHSLRYQRQELIKSIQDQTGYRLICYISVRQHITPDDVVPFMDLIHNVPEGQSVELLLNTPGGDIDAAEKLTALVRKRVGEAGFRIIVPDFAKSAGTLMVLGADSVVMSDTSELGPIDPQVYARDSNGNESLRPAQSHIDAYERYSDLLKKQPGDAAARMMLEKLDPSFLQFCQTLKDRAQKLAEQQLARGMFYGGTGNTTQTASELLNTKRWQTHSQMISWQDAKGPPIELEVEHVALQSPRWQQYWKLYCLQRLAIDDQERLFESDYVSQVLSGARR